MNKKDIEMILDRIEVLKSFLEGHSLEKFREQVLEVESFLQRFDSLDELLSHLKNLEGMAYTVKDFLTFEEACKYLQMKKSAVYKLTSARELTTYKPNGKNLFFLRADLDDWIRKNPVPSNEELERQSRLFVYNMDREKNTRQYKR